MSYNNRAHEIELRQKIASLERDKEGINEVAIACDILAACHPSEYLNALVRNYKRLLTSYEAAGGIFRQFHEEHSIMIGEKIPEENFEEMFVKMDFGRKDNPIVDDVVKEVAKYEGVLVENKEIDPKEIEVPDFLTGK